MTVICTVILIKDVISIIITITVLLNITPKNENLKVTRKTVINEMKYLIYLNYTSRYTNK